MLKIEEIEINRASYGTDAGILRGRVALKDEESRIDVKLSSLTISKILAVVAEEAGVRAKLAARQVEQNILEESAAAAITHKEQTGGLLT